MSGIGVVFGLPGVGFIVLYRKEQRHRSSYTSEVPIVSNLAYEITSMDTARLLKSAHKVAQKLGDSSKESLNSLQQHSALEEVEPIFTSPTSALVSLRNYAICNSLSAS